MEQSSCERNLNEMREKFLGKFPEVEKERNLDEQLPIVDQAVEILSQAELEPTM